MTYSAEHDRLLFLVERLQRQGKSEQQINDVVQTAIAESRSAQRTG